MTIREEARELGEKILKAHEDGDILTIDFIDQEINEAINKVLERETQELETSYEDLGKKCYEMSEELDRLREENERLRRLHTTAEGSFEKLAKLFENGSIIVPDTADKETVLQAANELDAIADLRDFCMGEST